MAFVNQRTHLIVFFAAQSGGFAGEKKCWWDAVLTHFVSLQMVPAGVVWTYCSNIQTRTFFFFFLLSIACLPGNRNINADMFSAVGGKKAQYSYVKMLYEIILIFQQKLWFITENAKKVLSGSYILISLQTHRTLKFSLNISKKIVFLNVFV